MKRIMIVGCSGSGKSTLARRVGEATGLPVVHMDKFYWKPGWELRPDCEMKRLVSETVKMDQWVFEGNYSRGFPERVKRSDVVVFLDMPRWLCMYRVIRRAIYSHGKTREDMAEGCPERLDWNFVKFLKFIYDYPKRSRPKALSLIENAPAHAKTCHLKNKRHVEGFLNTLKHDQLVA